MKTAHSPCLEQQGIHAFFCANKVQKHFHDENERLCSGRPMFGGMKDQEFEKFEGGIELRLN